MTEKFKIGFIGCGKMASAIINGIIKSGYISAEQVLASKSNPGNLEETAKKLGIKITLDNKEVAKFGDIIFIAVKPNQVKDVLEEIKALITPEKLIVSVAAGIKTEFIEKVLGENTKVVRVMPNTPVMVNEGMTGVSGGKQANKTDLEQVQAIFNSIGKSVIVEENQMDIVTAISGSGPAFFYKVINDIARAGEKLGLDYEKALLLSIQTAIGSGKMALNRTVSMEELISNVATKGGCTRVGVDVMEGVNGAGVNVANGVNTQEIFAEVIEKTAEKAKTLG